MRRIIFYRTESGCCPVRDFLNSLSAKQAAKVAWTLNLVETQRVASRTYLKKLQGTSGIWEVRVAFGGDVFRVLGFLDGDDLVVLNHGFRKKSQKTPRQDIEVAEQRRADYLRRKRT